MKKLLSLLLALVCVLSFYSCDGVPAVTTDGTSSVGTTEGKTTGASLQNFETTAPSTEEEPFDPSPFINPTPPQINTEANDIFFPVERNDLHREELRELYLASLGESNYYQTYWGDFEIYNFTSQEKSEQYDIDVFEAYYYDANISNYRIRHGSRIYEFSLGQSLHNNTDCFTNIAITDINADGYIEILAAITLFDDRDWGFFCKTYVRVIDTRTEQDVLLSEDGVSYLKENEDGIVSIYNTGEIYPDVPDVTNYKLNERFYDLATNLVEAPTLDIARYEFRKEHFEAACEMYSVEIDVLDTPVNFPYKFPSGSTLLPAFELIVKMTFLGETYDYEHGSGYLDGATAHFVNEHSEIYYESWMEFCIISHFLIRNGDVIKHVYQYNDPLDHPNDVGVYDMVISYRHQLTGVLATITLEDVLTVYR